MYLENVHGRSSPGLQEANESDGRAMCFVKVLFLGSRGSFDITGRTFRSSARRVHGSRNLLFLPTPRHRECQAEEARPEQGQLIELGLIQAQALPGHMPFPIDFHVDEMSDWSLHHRKKTK